MPGTKNYGLNAIEMNLVVLLKRYRSFIPWHEALGLSSSVFLGREAQDLCTWIFGLKGKFYSNKNSNRHLKWLAIQPTQFLINEC